MPTIAHPRTVLVEFLGAFVRDRGDWFPVAAVVTLLGELGLDASTVRTMVSRLKQRGWLEQERRSGGAGYRLRSVAIDALDEGDRVVWHGRAPVSVADGWTLAVVSVPEKEREKRHLLRSRLGGIGFGNVGPGVWLAPARELPDARALLDDLGLESFVDLFIAHYASGHDLQALVSRGWDLGSLNDDYRSFIRVHEPALESWAAHPGDDAAAFSAYMGALNRWRTLPFRDPGLPVELLGADWHGPAARALFERAVHVLSPAAGRHVAAQWPL